MKRSPEKVQLCSLRAAVARHIFANAQTKMKKRFGLNLNCTVPDQSISFANWFNM